jgi:hypothetical protein
MKAMRMPAWKRWMNFGWSRWVLLLAVVAAVTACVAPPVAVAPVLVQAGMTEEARCAAGGGTWDARNVVLPQGHCAKGSPDQCQATGGTWQRVCMMGTLACVQPYVDADKACRSGSDCQGLRCLQTAEARGQNPSKAQPQIGRCLPNNNPCFFGINLENGLPVPTAVAD